MKVSLTFILMDKTKMAVDAFDKRASEYAVKFMDVGMYHDTFDLFCDSIAKEGAEVLEIACGPGNITKYLLQKRPDLNILGTDLAPNMLLLAAANNPTAQFGLMDAKDLGKIERKYDAVMCGFCLPYLSREEAVQFIQDAAGVLAANGVLYLSTMEDDYSKSGMGKSSYGDELYMHYHEAGYIVRALEDNGLKIISEQHLSCEQPNGSYTTDLVIIAGK